jgi:carboxypeptidase C (cathepsin A)
MESVEAARAAEKEKEQDSKKPAETGEDIPEPVVRSHRIKIGSRAVSYTTTCGLMPIRNDKGELVARLFFTAYSLNQPVATATRPLTFAFNGGPGSASVWLHMGGLAPKRVKMLDDGAMPRPPFQLVDNEYTWLDATDIVFLDPVDTGYSRATSEEHAKAAKSKDGDLESVAEFIRMYLTRYSRWTSPLFLAGESYGTFRAAGLSGLLIEKGIAFNGIILISSILNMQTARFTMGNDLPYSLFFPTYAATAWYHKRLAVDLQAKELRAFLDEVEEWVEQVYVPSLSLGDRISPEELDKVVAGIARYTGLSREFVRQTDIRINIQQFAKELLRSQRKTVGRLDGRFTGFDQSGVTDVPDYDPSLSAIRPPFTTVLNQYIRTDLGYETDVEYHILRGLDWTYGDASNGYADTSDALRSAFAKNPYMHLFVASGYYDMATPYYATYYTLSHSNISADVWGNVETREYPTGHMVYIDSTALQNLRDDVVAFIEHALTGEAPQAEEQE